MPEELYAHLSVLGQRWHPAVDRHDCAEDRYRSQKKGKLLDFNINGQITDLEYLQLSRDCELEIERLQKQLLRLQQELESKEDFRNHVESIRAVMQDAQRDAIQQIVSKEFIDQYIDRSFASPQEDGSLRLEINTFIGETTEKYLVRLKKRAGDVSRTNRES